MRSLTGSRRRFRAQVTDEIEQSHKRAGVSGFVPVFRRGACWGDKRRLIKSCLGHGSSSSEPSTLFWLSVLCCSCSGAHPNSSSRHSGMPRVNGAWVLPMRPRTAKQLDDYAISVESKINRVGNTDDPKWLQRGVERLRRSAARKKKAASEKRLQRKKGRHKKQAATVGIAAERGPG